MCNERESFPDSNVWSDQVTYKFNGTMTGQNCVYWATENPNLTEERAVNLQGTSVWCGRSSRGMLCRSLQLHCQQCIGANGGHFQHL
jgi:hypothetical protein